MNENEIAKTVLDCCFEIHKKLGPGLLESVYEEILYYELSKHNINSQRQVAIPVIYDKLKMEIGFRAGIIVDGKVIIELKSVETILDVHKK